METDASGARPDDTALSHAVQGLLQRLKVERRYSDNTIEAYRRDLDRLTAFARARAITDWRDFSAHHLRRFLRQAHQEHGLAPASVRRLLSSVRALFRHLVFEGALTVSPAIGLRGPKAARKLPQVLDVDEIDRLLAFEPQTPDDLRDKAMLELMYSSGLRRAEISALRWMDLDLQVGLLRIQKGKGGKSRDVPIGSRACTALQALRDNDPASTGHTPVFRGPRGQALSGDGIWRRVRAVALRQGLDKRVHPHLLRHCCGSHFLESSGDLRGTQELLGHADISSTQIYTHLDFQHLARVYDAAHPRARRKAGA